MGQVVTFRRSARGFLKVTDHKPSTRGTQAAARPVWLLPDCGSSPRAGCVQDTSLLPAPGCTCQLLDNAVSSSVKASESNLLFQGVEVLGGRNVITAALLRCSPVSVGKGPSCPLRS